MSADPSKANEFYWRAHYGIVPFQVSMEMMIQFGKAVMIIVGADGEVSPPELDHFIGNGKCLGAPPEMVEALMNFDFRTAKLEDCLKGFQDGAPTRAMIYDAIQTARADGKYAYEEQAAVAQAAKILGIDHSVVTALEGLVEMEETLRKTRGALFATEIKIR